ncbi:MAG TPA: SRPBCC family protein [Bacteroidia bacterium]|nr:SRPBCC family protein [Bacteroidia bacterium]
MTRKILLVLAAAIAILLVAAAFRPDTIHVSRSTTIAAPPAAVFAVINDFRRWGEWSPWAKLDPEMKVSLEGPPTGVGAVYKWSGNNEVGEGSATLVESVPDEKVGMKLSFVRPFPGDSDVQFTFAPEGDGTKVTWSMQSPQPYVAKLVGVFMDCEKMCGDSFLEGLANLKQVVEKPTSPEG